MNSIRVGEILRTLEIRLEVSRLPGHQPIFGLEETVKGLRTLGSNDWVTSFPVAGESEQAFALVDEARKRVVGLVIPPHIKSQAADLQRL